MRILIIDDDVDVKKMFEDSIELWNDKHIDAPVASFEAPSQIVDPDEAQKIIETSGLAQYDGVVVDLRFKDQIKGTELLEIFNRNLLRVPTVVYTGTPDSVKGLCLKVCTKGEVKVDDIISWFYDVKMSGLMSVIGMKGAIENKLKDVFCRFQSQSLSRWAELGKLKGADVAERSAMRYVLMHLLDSLYCEDGEVFPDEMYLNVDKSGSLKTGDIVFGQNDNVLEYYLVMSPACDLVVRETGTPKTESVLLVGIVPVEEAAARSLSDKIAQWKKQGDGDEALKQKEEGFIKQFRRQRDPEYVHSVPCLKDMPGQYVAFRKVLHLPYEKVDNEFSRCGLRIAPPFLKDIQARFASYYGRQGQPDIDYSLEYEEKAQDAAGPMLQA